jgi:predicted phosphoadenosine phosphosulfate sulfurtransferase
MRSDTQERYCAEDVGIQQGSVPTLYGNETGGATRKGPDRLRATQTTKTVLEAAKDRLEIAFRDFDNVLVAFSCGKDSGVCLNLAYDFAKELGLLHKLAFYYEDYEAGYSFTHSYAQRMFDNLSDVRRFWLCLPISAACSVSMHQTRWIPWNPDEKDIWVRPMPTGDHVLNQDNCPYPFVRGTKGFDARIQFAEWFSKAHGKTAVIIGIRADESLTRRSIFTSQHRKNMHMGLTYTTAVDKQTMNFYPIYDWKTEDIWVANAKFGWDYNKAYDLFYQAGLTIDQMRIASPFHQSGQDNLKLFRVIDQNSWGKMVSRVNGVNFTGIYGGTTAMGWKSITKPKHFTWKQYADFLIETLPGDAKKKLLFHLARFEKIWSEKGYGRNPEVIQSMMEDGITIERTGEISKLCTKPKVYEIVKIKSGFPDETKASYSTPFRHCPSWKAVCITIMKNDFALTYMGCSRTKDMNVSRQRALDKYAARQLKMQNSVAEMENEDE